MRPDAIPKKLKAARQLLSDERLADALKSFQELSQLCPRSPAIWLEYGNAAAALQRSAQAEFAWGKARELAWNNARFLLRLGHRYQASRLQDQARQCYLQAADADPRDINVLISLAALLERNHQVKESRALVDRCLALDGQDEQARYFSAVLDRREGDFEAAERRLRDLIAARPQHPYVNYACRYELAQVFDRTGRPDEAMAALVEAKAIVRKLADIDEVSGFYDAMVARRLRAGSRPRGILRRWAKSFPEEARQAPVRLAFLGGHPRSGTTLMEQILGAHPQIAAVDEPHLFSTILGSALEKSKSLRPSRINALRQAYVSALGREFGALPAEGLLLEKNPSLTSALPMWLRLFPELRVIIALRDPRDVVLSCFFQNIPLNVANANFLSLDRAAKHYASLMDVWLAVREWKGFDWIETRYEDTVADVEKEGRKVTAFLGLEWREEQAQFHQHRRPIFSPSYRDVVLPIHARSAGRWLAYKKYLAPILPALEPYCRAFGYS